MLCLITDRRRLSPGTSYDVARARLLNQAAWASRTGIELIQIRERDLDGARLAALVDDVLRTCRGSGTRVIVNDRIDVALACGADGVHLRHDSVPAQPVRALAPPGFLIGRSVGDVAGAEASGPVDYLIAGAVFATPSKPAAHRTLGLEGLRAIVCAASVPVLAIGGMREGILREVSATGAAGIAGIGMFIGSFDTQRPPS